MQRQSNSIPKPNDERLKAQIEKEEYSTKSELVNDLIWQAPKQHDWIRAKLERTERSGFTTDTKEQILKQSKSMLDG